MPGADPVAGADPRLGNDLGANLPYWAPSEDVLQRFGENEFIEQPTRCEFDISEYERVTLEKLPELLKTTLLITRAVGAFIAIFACISTV